MATFPFKMHRVRTKYPDSGDRLKLGNSYEFTAPPAGPDQRTFILKFAALVWFSDVDGNLDETVNPEINLFALDQFYNLHKMNLTFTYEHPVYGPLACRFNKPLEIPEGDADSFGVVKDIEIELIEVPGLSDSGISDMIQVQYVDF